MAKQSYYPNICLQSLRTLRKTCVLSSVQIGVVLRASLRGKCYINQPSEPLLTSGKNMKQISYIGIQGKDNVRPIENLITVQQDTTYSVYYISVGSSTCFGC